MENKTVCESCGKELEYGRHCGGGCKTQHTPTPKKQCHHDSASTQFTDRGSERMIWNEDGFLIGTAINEFQANRIVRAVNAHADLIEALKEASKVLREEAQDGTADYCDEAIAKAEGK